MTAVMPERSAVDSGRDYACEMRTLLDAATAEGPYVPRVVASEIVAKLDATDPDLLSGWLHAQAENILWQTINDRDRSRRAMTRHQAPRKAFASAVSESTSTGTSEPLRKYLDMRFSVADGTRRALATLTAGDLNYVADTYQRRANQNALMEQFMRAMAKKVKGGTVADHYTEDQVKAMFESVAV